VAFAVGALWFLLSVPPALGQTSPRPTPRTQVTKSGVAPAREEKILWQPWDRGAFEEARRTGRLVLLHITASWSHSAHEMDLDAWTDSAVVRIVYQSFVPIRVDADRRPDIADRYLAGGWPTTAVLEPGGQMLGAQAVIGASGLKQMLTQLRDLYAKNRADVERRSAESARRVARTWEDEAPVAPTMDLDDFIDRNVSALRDAEDRTNGGIVGKPKTPQFESVRFLLAAAASRKDTALRGLALRILDAALRLEDPVWGGFYRMATEEDWKRPRTEKLLDVNARALGALVRAVDAGGGTKYREAARRTEAYAAAWLWNPRGGWYGSQDPDVPHKDGTLLAGEVYYSLRDELRRKQGLPMVDSSLYADGNARMAAAILRGAQTGMWKGATVARAVKAMDRLWSEQRAKDGSLYHEWRNGARAVPGRLIDQALAGQAYLEAYVATKESRHLARADSLAAWIRNRLEDKRGGGFRYAPRNPDAIGRLAAGEKPDLGNLEAAWFYIRFWEVKRRPEDRRSAQRALDFLRSGEVVSLDPAQAELGLRLEQAASASP
jgi:uncharacterized protein YyaL (SSP411 family)